MSTHSQAGRRAHNIDRGGRRWAVVGLCAAFAAAPLAAQQAKGWKGLQRDLGAFRQVRFEVEGATARVALPRHPVAGHPWVWRFGPLAADPVLDQRLLARGFYVVHLTRPAAPHPPGGANDDPPKPSSTELAHAAEEALFDYLSADQGLGARVHLIVASDWKDQAAAFVARDPQRVAAVIAAAAWPWLPPGRAYLLRPEADRLDQIAFLKRHAAPGELQQDWHWLRAGLANSKLLLEKERRLRIAFLGGSITYNPGWKEMVVASLQAQHPQATLEVVAAGIPSVDSSGHAFRLERDVFLHGPVDLLVVEAAVNDATNGRDAREQLRAMEGTVRAARRINPALDVVFLHFATPAFLNSQRQGLTPEVVRVHERVADHYALPSIDLAREVGDRIDRGEFRWKEDFVDLHPSPFGQRLYAEALLRLLQDAWRAAAPGTKLVGHPMPAMLDRFSYDGGQLLDVENHGIAVGWWIDESWRPRDGAGVRRGFVDVPMLVTDEKNAPVLLHFEGRGVGIWAVVGPDVGVLEYSIDFGPFRTLDLRTRWSAGLHLPWVYLLATDLEAGDHRLEMHLSESTPADRGWLRIAWFLVNR